MVRGVEGLTFGPRIAHHVDVAVAVQPIGSSLGEVLSLEGHQVHGDAFGAEFPGLAFQRFLELLPAPGPFSRSEFRWRDGLSGAGLGMGVVRRPARALLRVLLLAPLGPAILEPHLEQGKLLDFSIVAT